uniref:Uncharacterized protein n=1 Tax=Anguilla anguilla TaxID=7936 RepID=A0A0E9XJC0_ANGAN
MNKTHKSRGPSQRQHHCSHNGKVSPSTSETSVLNSSSISNTKPRRVQENNLANKHSLHKYRHETDFFSKANVTNAPFLSNDLDYLFYSCGNKFIFLQCKQKWFDVSLPIII